MIYTGLKYQGKTPWTINIYLKENEGRGEMDLFWGGYQWEMDGYKERGNEVNMIDVFCIHI
jgi:hypothetical protein